MTKLYLVALEDGRVALATERDEGGYLSIEKLKKEGKPFIVLGPDEPKIHTKATEMVIKGLVKGLFKGGEGAK